MKFQLLPSSFNENGSASLHQHLTCFVIDDFLAIDAGSLAMATNEVQKKQIRNVVLTHTHLDHIAGLPLFIDDLFVTLETPLNRSILQKIKSYKQFIFHKILNLLKLVNFSNFKNLQIFNFQFLYFFDDLFSIHWF